MSIRRRLPGVLTESEARRAAEEIARDERLVLVGVDAYIAFQPAKVASTWQEDGPHGAYLLSLKYSRETERVRVWEARFEQRVTPL